MKLPKLNIAVQTKYPIVNGAAKATRNTPTAVPVFAIVEREIFTGILILGDAVKDVVEVEVLVGSVIVVD
ncbi:hypothetical protein BHYA_0217g00070 [Botrytis hyacinthi]|uniref:Uncharacterized protein n=1 Tax=Botrytis hyacinthi TaxID=278943 RepID=A0A4Z1GAH9_9HELO|nr:hypothetical protein BHYA_0217g00070 [Botrytis hyacinthi]